MNDIDSGPPYTVEETGEKLNISSPAVRSALRRGKLAGFKLGRDWRVVRGPVDRLARAGKETAA
jgi:excisionase family DNA binding protein